MAFSSLFQPQPPPARTSRWRQLLQCLPRNALHDLTDPRDPGSVQVVWNSREESLWCCLSIYIFPKIVQFLGNRKISPDLGLVGIYISGWLSLYYIYIYIILKMGNIFRVYVHLPDGISILVGGFNHLENMKVNGKDDIPYIMNNKTCLKPPTRYIYICKYTCKYIEYECNIYI